MGRVLHHPLDFLRRLAARLPGPYRNLVRYHGCFASRSKMRGRLPAPPERAELQELERRLPMHLRHRRTLGERAVSAGGETRAAIVVIAFPPLFGYA